VDYKAGIFVYSDMATTHLTIEKCIFVHCSGRDEIVSLMGDTAVADYFLAIAGTCLFNVDYPGCLVIFKSDGLGSTFLAQITLNSTSVDDNAAQGLLRFIANDGVNGCLNLTATNFSRNNCSSDLFDPFFALPLVVMHQCWVSGEIQEFVLSHATSSGEHSPLVTQRYFSPKLSPTTKSGIISCRADFLLIEDCSFWDLNNDVVIARLYEYPAIILTGIWQIMKCFASDRTHLTAYSAFEPIISMCHKSVLTRMCLSSRLR
jgi:hypothetical protein